MKFAVIVKDGKGEEKRMPVKDAETAVRTVNSLVEVAKVNRNACLISVEISAEVEFSNPTNPAHYTGLLLPGEEQL